jgi:hypothetical protein
MANDFKRFTAADLTNNTGASADAVYTVPAGSGASALESIVIGITISNKTTSDRTFDLFLDNYTGSDDVYLAKGVSIPANTTVEFMQGNKIVLQNSGSAGDVLRASADAGSALDVAVSVLEDV